MSVATATIVRRFREAARDPVALPMRSVKQVEIAGWTGPLDLLADHEVLAVADCQNLNMGARDLGLRVRWDRLGEVLRRASRSAALHAFVAEPAGATTQSSSFAEWGWMPHGKTARFVETWRGRERRSNTDNVITFMAGVLASRSRASLLLVLSGDADLVEGLAEGAAMLPKTRKIATLSLAGSTGYRLNAATSEFVTANLELGMDCLERRVFQHQL